MKRLRQPILFLRALFLLTGCAMNTCGQLFVPSGVRFSTASPSNGITVKSSNGLYEVTVEETGANATSPFAVDVPLLGTMSKVSSDSRTPLWATKFQGLHIRHFAQSDILVSDAGDFFLVTRGLSTTKLIRKGQTFDLDFSKGYGRDLFLSFGEKYIVLDELNGERIVRSWNRSKNSWEAVNITNGLKISASIPKETIAKWNEEQRHEIIDRIYAAKREMLRRKVAQTVPTLGKIAANTVSQSTNVFVTEGDYEFLTLQRNPEDRHWLEELLAYEDDQYSSSGAPTFYRRSPEQERQFADFVQTGFVRARVDWLLGIWDKKVSESTTPGIVGQADESNLTRFQLGKIFGRVQFALPINIFTSLPKPPPADGPMIHILLIPADRAKIPSSSLTESIDVPLAVYRDRVSELTDSITFAFTTVRPGAYQLKAIWDKRAPYSATNFAGPGDYESILSAPIQVTAAGITPDIVLHCTNRIAGGEAYYTADDTLRYKSKITGEISRHTFVPDKDGRLDTYWRNASFWIIATNQAPSTNWARIESIGATTFGRVTGSEIPRPDRLVIVLRRNSNADPLNAECPKSIRIFDEHSCSYKEAFWEKSEGGFRFVFFQFPRPASTWRIVGYNWASNSRQLDENIIFDYTITNLIRAPARELRPVSLPTDIDVGAATLQIKSITGRYIEPTIDAEFLENGQRAKNWRIREAFTADADGNLINPLEICRAQKTVTVVGRVSNSESTASIPFEVTISRYADLLPPP